jgi:hypothetical protein
LIKQCLSGARSDDPEIDRLIVYYKLGSVLGWAPSEIDRLDVPFVYYMCSLIDEVKKKEQENNK